MELFKADSVDVKINLEISVTCLLNDCLYICGKDGVIHKYDIKRNREDANIDLKHMGSYVIKKNKEISKVVIVEVELIIIILIDDILYFVKNDKFENLMVISKNVENFTINENNKLELLIYTKKKKLCFYKYDHSNYKIFKEIQHTDIVSSLLWVNKSLFLTVGKNYYLQSLRNNDKILLYSHEYEQTYKYITLINMNEIFIVCDLNIGVFYDVDTSMPSRKNTITLSESVKHVISFRFFLCCMNSNGVLNFYNVNNQQHVQSIYLNDHLHVVTNYSNVNNNSNTALISLFNFFQRDNEGKMGGAKGQEERQNGQNGRNSRNDQQDWKENRIHDQAQEEKQEGQCDKKDTTGEDNHQALILDEEVTETRRNTQVERYIPHNDPFTEEKKIEEILKSTTQSGTYNYAKNNIYFLNNHCLKIIRCLELYEYLPKCIEQKKIEKGFLLIQNYNFENDIDKENILKEYNKACAYYYFSNLNFPLAFLHFEKVNINIFVLLSFWFNLFPQTDKLILQKKIKQKNSNEKEMEEQAKTLKKLAEEESMINKHFKGCFPPLCSIEELIRKNYNYYHNDDRYLQHLGEERKEDYSSSASKEEDAKKKKKKEILYIANNCMIKYLLSKRDYLMHHRDSIKVVLGGGEDYAQVSASAANGVTNPMHNNNQAVDSPPVTGCLLQIDEILDNVLVKLMIKNKYVNYSKFIMETENLSLNVNECVEFLKENCKFVEIILIYIRYKQFGEAIEMCLLFLRYYSVKWGEVEGEEGEVDIDVEVEVEEEEEVKEKVDMGKNGAAKILDEVEEDIENAHVFQNDSTNGLFQEKRGQNISDKGPNSTHEEKEKGKKKKKKSFWLEILEKQDFKSNIDKMNSFHLILKEIYNILIILNDNVHLINVEQKRIKLLFEYSFPFFIKYNENLFFDFLINKNFLLRPDEILQIFTKLQKRKYNIKVKHYVQKYIVNYLKYDKYNTNINTALVELYMNDLEKPVQVRQKKILHFLHTNYPIEIDYLIRIIKDEKFNLVKALLYGKIHKHYESLVILSSENISMCEKYCLYYNFILKGRAKRMSQEDHERLLNGIYKDDKTIHEHLFKEYDEGRMELINTHLKKEKRKKIYDAFITDIMREYHKYSYITMSKDVLSKMKKKEQNKKNHEKIDEEEKEREKKKKEFDYMLHLVGQQDESNSSDDDITNFYEMHSDRSSKETEFSVSSCSLSDVSSSNSLMSKDDDDDDGSSSLSVGTMSSSGEDARRRKIKRRSGEKKGKRKKMQREKAAQNEAQKYVKKGKKKNIKNRDSYHTFLGNKHRNRDIDLFNYFKVYESCKNRSCGLYFLLVKVCMNKYNESNLDEKEKEKYKKYILYILNKYANHNDFDNIYIYELIPEEWKISEILSFVNLGLQKKLNTNMNLLIYHNLVKSHYLNVSYDLIEQKERSILVQDRLICKVCNGQVVEKSFAYFSEEVITHVHCIDKYDEEIYK
ncbi:vacuolar protein sorting-associated protein 3 [Plasmodium brasilianum]|uniref:Vacuolar protein sorting-associated protein 3 n=1 Tax=Plasmodium brasilianum TaxID=5824 RepID=A0ACB9Y467_PLABR|nr:vacuolar protein sorting-associated protein 3 [Plasmodium brasilianum]